MGANEGRSRTLVLYVFVLTVSGPNVPPGKYQDHQTTVEAQDESHDINTGKMFSAFEKPTKKIREETPAGSSPLSLSRPRSALSRFMVILVII